MCARNPTTSARSVAENQPPEESRSQKVVHCAPKSASTGVLRETKRATGSASAVSCEAIYKQAASPPAAVAANTEAIYKQAASSPMAVAANLEAIYKQAAASPIRGGRNIGKHFRFTTSRRPLTTSHAVGIFDHLDFIPSHVQTTELKESAHKRAAYIMQHLHCLDSLHTTDNTGNRPEDTHLPGCPGFILRRRRRENTSEARTLPR